MATGLIIAGGRSTRFGDRDKAVADLAGTPMVRRVADRLAAANPIDRLVVNCRPDQREAIDAALAGCSLPTTFAEDPEPDQGPLAGILTGLRAVPTEYAFVVACDMPFLDPSLVAFVLAKAAGHDAAIPRLGKWFQPTHAAYRVEPMAAACQRALDRGETKPIAPLDDLDAVVVEEGEIRRHGSKESFENLNTREEFEDAAARLG